MANKLIIKALACAATAVVLAVMPFAAISQSNLPEIDSLTKIADNSPDTLKAKLYGEICWKLRNYDPQKALEFGEKSYSYAQKCNDLKMEMRALSNIGVCHRNIGNYQEAVENYTKGLELAQQYNVKDQIAYGHINIGNIYLYHDEWDNAQEQLLKALEIGLEIKDSSILAYSYLNLGRINLSLNQNQKAFEYLQNCLVIREKTDDEWDKIATVKKYLGDALSADNKFAEALQFYIPAISGNYDIKDYDLLSDLYGRIAEAYINTDKNDSALYYAEKCLEVSKMRGIDFRIKNAHKYLGDVYVKRGDLQKAIDNYTVVMAYADTFWNARKTYGIENIEYQIDKVKKENEIAMLHKEQELDSAHRLILVLIIVMALGGAVFFALKNRQKRITNKILTSQKNEIEAQNLEISTQRNTLAEKNKLLEEQRREINDSILYAQHIQFSMLPQNNDLNEFFADSFVFYRPRNVVSGDFYWAFKDADYFIFMVADCTGHGVPGAFMSMLGFSALNEIVGREGLRKADDVLNGMRDTIKHTLNKAVNSNMRDGMDAALLIIDKKTNALQYAGANIPFILFRGDEQIIIKPVRNPIGLYVNEKQFESKDFQLMKGDKIYLASDGYQSQFGGPKNHVLKTSGYRRILSDIHNLPMAEQRQIIEQRFDEWRGHYKQTDDIIVVGLEV